MNIVFAAGEGVVPTAIIGTLKHVYYTLLAFYLVVMLPY